MLKYYIINTLVSINAKPVINCIARRQMRGKEMEKWMYDRQFKALVNARSVEGRIFTKEDHASNHCQVRNIGLTLNYIIDWINRKSSEIVI